MLHLTVSCLSNLMSCYHLFYHGSSNLYITFVLGLELQLFSNVEILVPSSRCACNSVFRLAAVSYFAITLLIRTSKRNTLIAK